MPTYSEIAYAKINLALHVRNKRSDGYHELETLFGFLDVGDALTAGEATGLTLTISGRFGNDLDAGDENLVLRTARLLQSRFGVASGAALSLEKNLPIASGIGGGSADAAATARLLTKLWALGVSETELSDLLAPLGADIPACVASVTVIGRGTGTELHAVNPSELSGMPVLLVNPLKLVSTGEVFARWDSIDRGCLINDSSLATALEGRNDLEAPAISICSEIADVLQILQQTSAILTRMSGSGATCFGLYPTMEKRDAAQAKIADKYWTLAGNLR